MCADAKELTRGGRRLMLGNVSGVRITEDDGVELSMELANEALSRAAEWAMANPTKAAVVACICYPAYARAQRAKHVNVGIIGYIGVAANLIGEHIFERVSEVFGSTEDEELDEAWKPKGPEERPN